MRAWAMGWILVGCTKSAQPPIAAEPAPVVSVASTASSAPTGPMPPAARAAAIVYRILHTRFVTDDAGVPTDMAVTLQIEAGGSVVGPFTLDSPGCSFIPNASKTIVSTLSCYYAGYGDYVEIHEKTPGHYAVIAYGQSESYPDEPAPKKQKLRTLGTFVAAPRLVEDHAIVAADGRAYKPYQ